MGRSVVRAGTDRCDRCRLPPRWCVCGLLRAVPTATAVDILMHRREQWRPSSSGALAARVVDGVRLHVHRPDARSREAPRLPGGLFRPGHACWVLHPHGEPPPIEEGPLQVVLLDGTWREAAEMLRLVEDSPAGAGERIRVVRLPVVEGGRFWIRHHEGCGRTSTAEALLALLAARGEDEAVALLRLHLELHVWATLRARGKRAEADLFLAGSPLSPGIPAAIEARRES